MVPTHRRRRRRRRSLLRVRKEETQTNLFYLVLSMLVGDTEKENGENIIIMRQ